MACEGHRVGHAPCLPSVAEQIIRNSGCTFSEAYVEGMRQVKRKKFQGISNKREAMRGAVACRRAAFLMEN